MSVAAADPRALLAAPDASLAQVMAALDALGRDGALTRTARVGISANVTIDLLGTFLRRHGALDGVAVDIHQGGYDDPIGDMAAFGAAGVEHVVLLALFDNLLPAFEVQAANLPAEDLAAKLAEVEDRLALALDDAAGFRTVFVATFHPLFPALAPRADDPAAAAIARLNAWLAAEAARRPNVRLVDMGALVAEIGRTAAIDPRFYFRAKAPYRAAALDRLARACADASRGFGARFHKALVLDCDNTLWGGIVGEDGVDGLKLGPFDHPGNVFWRIQHELSRLERAGVLLCLCSKNEAADVDEVFARHPNMVLRPHQIVARRINWDDKPANLAALAAELGIGLDAMVFLDDSAFECAAVRGRLPEVRVHQVPAQLSDYPALLGEIAGLFLAGGVTEESRSKTEQYRRRAAAIEAQAGFASHQDYLASLGLVVRLARDDASGLRRAAELAQKSNQFNLTTIRHSEADLAARMADPACDVWTLDVADRFGAAGLTGLVVVAREGAVARVETFLMSCRVIGRGIEHAIWPAILAHAAAEGCTEIAATYRPTAKNAQVAAFWDGLGLAVAARDDVATHYHANLGALELPAPAWIEVRT